METVSVRKINGSNYVSLDTFTQETNRLKMETERLSGLIKELTEDQPTIEVTRRNLYDAYRECKEKHGSVYGQDLLVEYLFEKYGDGDEQ